MTKLRGPQTSEEKKMRGESIRKLRLDRYLQTPFEKLGMVNRRRRVFEEQDYKCNGCSNHKWRGFPIALELEHKDGNNQNNSRINLEGLCPNCHSITPTWRGRNRKDGVDRNETILRDRLKVSKTIRGALIESGFTPSGKNYEMAKRLRGDKL